MILLIILVFLPVCISNNTDFSDQFVEETNNKSSNVYSDIINYIDVHYQAIIAIVTVIVGVFTVLMEIKKRRENRPIIDVQRADYTESGPKGILKLYLSALNNGQSAVTLSSIGIEIPEYKKHYLSDKYLLLNQSEYDLPFDLKPGARPLRGGYGVYINITEISETLKSKGISEGVEAFFFLKDGLGRKYRCESPFIFPLTIEDFEKL